MPSDHALLSPSAAHRWLNCPAAPRLEALMPDGASAAAEEGTLAHAIAARKLKRHLGIDTAAEDAEIEALAPSYHEPAMEEYTDTYTAIVLETLATEQRINPDARLIVEQRLALDPYIPGGFGTSDAIILGSGTIHVFDFKYGKGVEVSAADNPQMMIYAIGALLAFPSDTVTTVAMTIVQPRTANISTHSIPVDRLMRWATATLQPAARLATNGGGPQTPGDWCRFCHVKPLCPALALYCAETTGSDHRLLSPAELAATVLPRLTTIRQWADAVEEFALRSALQGTDFPGFRLVEASARRRVTDPDTLVASLHKAGYSDFDIFKPREIVSLTDLERLMGRRNFATLVAPHLSKAKGAPKLAPAADKRPDFFNYITDFDGIED